MPVRVRPISANLTHDTETFGKMSPYVKIYFGGSSYKTRPCESGGKTPSWNQTFVFNPTGDSNLRVEVWDSDSTSDDLIGEGTCNLMKVYNMPQMCSDNEWIDLYYKGRPAGRILISFQLQNMNGMWGGGQQGMMGNMQQQPMMGGYGQQPMMGGGYGQQPMMGGGWGQQPMMGGYGQQPMMGGSYDNHNNGYGKRRRRGSGSSSDEQGFGFGGFGF